MSGYAVVRSVTIDASNEEVFGRVVDFDRWPEWSPWQELDPDMEKESWGEPGKIGSGYSWSGNRKAGEGSMEMTLVHPSDRMEANLTFLKPFKSENTMSFLLDESDGATTITWTMNATHSLMTRVMHAFGMMDKMIGKDFDKGLAKLKSLSEAASK